MELKKRLEINNKSRVLFQKQFHNLDDKNLEKLINKAYERNWLK